MKKNVKERLRGLNINKLHEHLRELEGNYVNAIVNIKSGSPKKDEKINELRYEISLVKTIMNEIIYQGDENGK